MNASVRSPASDSQGQRTTHFPAHAHAAPANDHDIAANNFGASSAPVYRSGQTTIGTMAHFPEETQSLNVFSSEPSVVSTSHSHVNKFYTPYLVWLI